jgi:hypothetical protein
MAKRPDWSPPHVPGSAAMAGGVAADTRAPTTFGLHQRRPVVAGLSELVVDRGVDKLTRRPTVGSCALTGAWTAKPTGSYRTSSGI